MKKCFTVNSLKELDNFAKEFAPSLKGGECVALIGELGSGKTTFVKALVKHLQGKTEAASPSFTLLYQYETENGLIVEHWDLYRVKNIPLDLLEPPVQTSIRVIEWADKMPDYQNLSDYLISFKIISKNKREICLKKN